ncbi:MULTISPECIES: CaiB/BaiF CoA transferase family protein [Pseudonocardia]|uniref:Formyl-coenzyme A transferase n=2 Tax=Pseudonocardia TaxID=1847 RepID=A0A1Y2MSB6_PSEAH|nr:MULTISPECIES: CoA transferase [Pseudonocardia]OSY37859.1 Formyl-coenzyme A transferase [Pseudonocardia autotrophica]TDN72478.1 formyl-CoA transferase [Pseudonocardia autotrophica]BBG03187.1 formyl-CoA transferase [Pseudonocardia autotrophica]GEC23803.1 formyl-CoA transferase [Pseudonocardia saturnea]
MTTDPPLTGLLVLEVGAFMAAPFATMQLADLGARVVKVEPPGAGDPTRSAGPFLDGESSPFLRLNRNKESVALDLKDERGRDAFLSLADRADVVVENLRPGAMDRLGLGADVLRERRPELVYASASGWGQDGPAAGRAGLDIMAQAASGLMSVTGEPGGDPVKVGVPVCDLVTGLYVALAVTAALRERDRSGVGQHIDVSLLESGVSLAVWEAGMYFGDGEVPVRHGSAHQRYAPYQAVRTADGYVTVGANTERLWSSLCDALGLGALREDPRFADSTARMAARDELIAAIEQSTTTMPTTEVRAALDAAGVPCAPIAGYDEVFEDPVLRERGFLWEAEHPGLGPVRQLGSPMRFSRTPARRGNPGPALGSATSAVLAELAGPAVDPDLPDR